MLFGGERGGGDETESLVISAAADGVEDIDLELQTPPAEFEREAEAELEGGHACMATTKFIKDKNLQSEFNIIASTPNY